MSTTATTRSERIDLRTNSEVKSIIERAAQLRHTTISAYLLDSALQKAIQDIRETETLLIHDSDREMFFSALANPPEPNEALCALFGDAKRGTM
mgnify:FL=1